MSHTTRLANGTWIAIHNQSPDIRDEITFRKICPEGSVILEEHSIPYGAIHDFVAETIRYAKIAKLESAYPNEVFDL